jgi:hypothetical protein
MTPGEMQIDGGVIERGMAELYLNGAWGGASFQQRNDNSGRVAGFRPECHHRPPVTKYEPGDPEPDSKSLPV